MGTQSAYCYTLSGTTKKYESAYFSGLVGCYPDASYFSYTTPLWISMVNGDAIYGIGYYSVTCSDGTPMEDTGTLIMNVRYCYTYYGPDAKSDNPQLSIKKKFLFARPTTLYKYIYFNLSSFTGSYIEVTATENVPCDVAISIGYPRNYIDLDTNLYLVGTGTMKKGNSTTSISLNTSVIGNTVIAQYGAITAKTLTCGSFSPSGGIYNKINYLFANGEGYNETIVEVTIKCIFGVEERTNSETGNKERYIYTESVSLSRSVPFSFSLEVLIAYDDNTSNIECALEGYDWRYISGNILLTVTDTTASKRPEVTQVYSNGSYGGYGFAGVCFVDEDIKVGPGAQGNTSNYDFEDEGDIIITNSSGKTIYRFSTYSNIGVY